MKARKVCLLIFVFLLIGYIAAAQVYPRIRGKDYGDTGQIRYCYSDSGHVSSKLTLTYGNGVPMGGVLETVGAYKAYLTDFERCLATDIFKIFNNRSRARDDRDKYSSIGGYYAPLKGDIFINSAAVMLFGMFYRHIWGEYFYAVFSIILVLLAFATSEHFKDRYLTCEQRKRELRLKLGPLFKLAACTFAAAAVLNIVSGLVLPHFLPADCVRGSGIGAALPAEYLFFWGNALTIAVFVLTEAMLIFMLLGKSKRLLLAYLLPALLFCAVYYPAVYIFFFRKIYGTMLVMQFIPLYTKLFFFVFALLPEVLAYYVFGGMYTKSRSKRIVYAVTFAFCTSFLWTVNGTAVLYLAVL